MKKAILFLLAVGSFAVVHAQKGSILAFGDASFSTATDFNEDKIMNWQFAPGVGYQFHDNLTAGINLGWGQQSLKKLTDTDPTVINNYKAGAFFRYTYPLGNVFAVFAQFNAGYQGTYTTLGGIPAFAKGAGVYANIMPALAINVWKGLALNFAAGHIGYETMTLDVPTNPTRSGFDFTFGQQLNIGISKNFNCRSKSSREPMGELRNLNIDED